MKQMKKRFFPIFLSLLLFFLGIGGVSACDAKTSGTDSSKDISGRNSTTDKGSQGTSVGVSKEKTVIDLWHYFAASDGDAFLAMIDEYNKTNDKKIEVRATFVSREDLMKQYTMGAMSGELPDIGLIDNPDMASFIKMGIFEDITSYVEAWGQKDQFFEGPLKSCIYEDKIYGLPHNSNALALFYNTKVLAEKNIVPPTTWDELQAAVEALKTPEMYSLSLSAVKNEEGTFQFIPWLLSAGGNIEQLDSPEGVKTMTFLNQMVQDSYMSKDIINWTQMDAYSQFAGGKAAMMVNGPWIVPTLEKNFPDLEYGVTLLPKDKAYASVLGGENFGICTGANLEASWDFMQFMESAENSAAFCAVGGKFPPRADAMKLNDIWVKDPIMSVFAESMKYAMPRGPHPRWPEISDAISTAFHEVYTGVKTPEQAMKDAADKVEKLKGES